MIKGDILAHWKVAMVPKGKLFASFSDRPCGGPDDEKHAEGSLSGGQSGIRTLEGLAPLPVFKTGAFDHSANCPQSLGSLALCDALVTTG